MCWYGYLKRFYVVKLQVMQLYGAGIACLVLYYPSSPGTKRRLHYGSRDILDCYKEMMNSDKGKQLLKIFRLMSEQYIGEYLLLCGLISVSMINDDYFTQLLQAITMIRLVACTCLLDQ